MGGLPCQNPNCHSRGRWHPNCKCYGYAKGGRVGHFCVLNREHDKSCKYYMAKGGDTADWVDVPEPAKETKADSDWVDVPHNEASSDWVDVGAKSEQKDKYSSTTEKLKTAAEGLAQGIAGPFAALAETKLFGVNPEDIKGRKEANPVIHGASEAAGFVGSLAAPIGVFSGVSKVAGAVAKSAELGRIGTMALKGAMEGASFAASDEMTKSILSQPGSDPEDPAGAALLHVGASGLVGALSGGVFSFGEKMIGKASTPEMMKKLDKFLIGVGESKDPLLHLGLKDKMVGYTAKSIAAPVGAMAAVKGGPAAGMIVYEQIQKSLAEPISKIVEKRINPLVTDAAIKSILTNKSGLSNAVHYATNIAKGADKASKALDMIFKGGSSRLSEPVGDEAANFLKQFIEMGQVDTQLENSMNGDAEGFARGGEVSEKNDHFSSVFPEQNMVLSMAKGRISKYLNGLRPLSNSPKLPFDNEPTQTDKKRSYDNAIKIAVNPMSVLDHVNKGNLTLEHMQHFKSLYPETYKYLSKEMTKRITNSQLNKEKPPYKKRQAMSLFLGANLDSTFTGNSISTIQGLYTANKTQQQQQVPQKGSPKALAKSSNSYLTDSEARIRRSQNAKS